MDPSQLGEAIAVVAIVAAVGRFVLLPIGDLGDAMASLFVPPDRTLGWPHGVQESDEPWGWRPARTPEPEVIGGSDPSDDDRGDGLGASEPIEAALAMWRGTLVVPVRRVAPVRVGLRPH
jgi:hypothetical protein